MAEPSLPESSGAPRLELEGISRRFGATIALDSVSLRVAPGSVHAIIGENGAGKSTLMKVLSGAVKPDAGTLSLDGDSYRPAGPAEARRRGVCMIYQELTLAPDLTVAENMLLGTEPLRGPGLVDRTEAESRVREALDFLGHPEISPGDPVRSLGISSQQLVEVGRALVAEARVIIFDEPTSSLTRVDTQRLFEIIRRLRDRGVSVLYISHFLEEVREISDAYTILRDGRRVDGGSMDAITLDRIVELMVGRSVSEMFPRSERTRGEPALIVDSLAGRPLPVEASFTLHRGEILGIAGLVGSGRTEMLRAIFGLDPRGGGRVELVGRGEVQGPARLLREGVGLLSEDRKEEGLMLDLSITDNVTLGESRPASRLGWLDERSRLRSVGERLRELAIRARGPRQPVRDLSGGNQQKVAIARLVHQDAGIVLLDEPTRGVDVGSKIEIYRWMDDLARRGRAVLFVSSYLPELLGVADRIAVMRRGRLVAPRPVEELDEETLLRLALTDDASPET